MNMAFGFGKLGSLVVGIETDLTGLNKGLAAANQRVQKTSGEITRMTAQVGRQMTIMGGAITAGMALIVKSSIDFEDAFAGVRKTVEATEAEFQQLSDGLRKLSTEIPITAGELANIQEIAGQLGVSGVEALTKFTDTIAKISVTTNLTKEAAATDFARIANIMQEPIENVDRMGAAVVDLGNNSATTEAEIVSFANRIAGAGKIAGLTTADILGFGAAFSSVGVKAERGGTAVSKSLVMMGTAVTEGGDKLQKFATIAGLTSDEFIRTYKEDAGQAFALFIEGLGKAGLEGVAVLDELELGDQRLVQSFLSVGGASGILTESLDRANEAFKENTALNIEAEKRFKTTKSQLIILTNTLVEVGRKIGDTLIPALEPVIESFKEWLNKIGVFIKAHPQLTGAIAKIVTAIGLLMLALGPLMMMLPGLITTITFLSKTAIPALGKSMLWLVTNPIGLMISGIALLAIAWSQNWFNMQETTRRRAGQIGQYMEKFVKSWFRIFLAMEEMEKIPFLERTLRPLQSLKKAFTEADALINEFGYSAEFNFAEKYPAAIDVAIDKTQELKDLIGGIKPAPIVEDITSNVSVEGLGAVPFGPVEESVAKLLEQEESKREIVSETDRLFKQFRDNRIAADSDYYLQDKVKFEQGINEKILLIQTYNTMWMQAHAGMAAFTDNFIKNFHTGFSSALTDVIMGTKKASEAFKEFGMQMIESIVGYLAEQASAWLITQALQGVIVATQIALAKATALAWAPAAAMASLASFGTNAIPAKAGMATTTIFARALAIPKFAKGGIVTEPTIALVGEAGPEAITPLGAAGIDVTFNNYGDINTEVDLDELKNDLGEEVKKAIRGR